MEPNSTKLPEDEDLIKLLRDFLEEIKGLKEKEFCESMDKMILKIGEWTNEKREARFINLENVRKILKTRNEELLTVVHQLEWTIAYYQRAAFDKAADNKSKKILIWRALALFGKRFKRFFEGAVPAEIVAPAVSYSVEQFVKEENEKLQDEMEDLKAVARRGRRVARFALFILAGFLIYFFRFYGDAKEAEAQAIKASGEATKAQIAWNQGKIDMKHALDSISNAWKLQLDAKVESLAAAKQPTARKSKKRR